MFLSLRHLFHCSLSRTAFICIFIRSSGSTKYWLFLLTINLCHSRSPVRCVEDHSPGVHHSQDQCSGSSRHSLDGHSWDSCSQNTLPGFDDLAKRFGVWRTPRIGHSPPRFGEPLWIGTNLLVLWLLTHVQGSMNSESVCQISSSDFQVATVPDPDRQLLVLRCHIYVACIVCLGLRNLFGQDVWPICLMVASTQTTVPVTAIAIEP